MTARPVSPGSAAAESPVGSTPNSAADASPAGSIPAESTVEAPSVSAPSVAAPSEAPSLELGTASGATASEDPTSATPGSSAGTAVFDPAPSAGVMRTSSASAGSKVCASAPACGARAETNAIEAARRTILMISPSSAAAPTLRKLQCMAVLSLGGTPYGQPSPLHNGAYRCGQLSLLTSTKVGPSVAIGKRGLSSSRLMDEGRDRKHLDLPHSTADYTQRLGFHPVSADTSKIRRIRRCRILSTVGKR